LVVRRCCAASRGDPEAALALGFGAPAEAVGEPVGADVGEDAIADGGFAFELTEGAGVDAHPAMAMPSRMAGASRSLTVNEF
jgi:hypothetical protein